MKKTILTMLALAAIFALTGCSEDNNPTSVLGGDRSNDSRAVETDAAEGSVVEMIKALNADLGDFDTLLAALKSQNLVMPLVRYGKATVFAPTDEAFAALGLDETNVADLPGLDGILLYHVVAGKLFAADVLATDTLTMANDQTTMIGLRADGAYINDSRIDVTDLNTPVGVVHVINAVLLP